MKIENVSQEEIVRLKASVRDISTLSIRSQLSTLGDSVGTGGRWKKKEGKEGASVRKRDEGQPCFQTRQLRQRDTKKS